MSEFNTSTWTGSAQAQMRKLEILKDLDAEPLMVHPINVFVGGLPKKTTHELLTQFMSQFGYVKEVYISKDHTTGDHKCFAFVNFYLIFGIDQMFGRHKFLNRYIDVKRSLQHYLVLTEVPVEAKEPDIVKAFRKLGHRVSEVLVGGRIPGILPGTVGVRLQKYHHQVEVFTSLPVFILGKEVRKILHVRQPRVCTTQVYAGLPLPVGSTYAISHSGAPTLEPADIQLSKTVGLGPDSNSGKEADNCGSVGPNTSGTRSAWAARVNSSQLEGKTSECSVFRTTLHYQDRRHELYTSLPKFEGVTTQGSSNLSEHGKEFCLGTESPPMLAPKSQVMARNTVSSRSAAPHQTNQIWISFYAFPGHL